MGQIHDSDLLSNESCFLSDRSMKHSFGQQTIQQQQPMERVVCAGINSHRRQHHKKLVEQAMLAMRTTRFPIRRDTLSHLQQNTQNSSDYHYHPHHSNDALPIPTTAFIMDQKT